MLHINVIFTGEDVLRHFGKPPNLSNQQFINVQFIDADLSNANVCEAQFHDVQFTRCNLDGVDFTQATFTGNGNDQIV
jgi:uncharacterized protein YjbI with pentapeptide repeats